MTIKLKKFSPRPGLVNKQGRLPDPSELVCIEVPKIFDQSLIKKCLKYGEGQDTNTTDIELRSNPFTNSPKRYVGSRDFKINLISIDKIPLKTNPSFKKIILSYTISFYADYIDNTGVNESEFFEINRTDIIGKFYCPDSIAQISASSDENTADSNIIKLEMVAEALNGEIVEDEDENFYIDVTLGYYIVVKCSLLVQLLIPAYDYCPVPNEPCEEEPEEDPCERFEKAPVPKFYPDENLKPLFVDLEEYDDD
ncbi:MAG: hypothetical protein GX275_13075 [Clostridiales bacterium]|nr:hypothetical protein [Clostridiales bacterium]